MKRLQAAAAILWASPASALGFMVGVLGLATGGRAQRRGRVLEFWGGASEWLLRRLAHANAMTLGHTVLGRSQLELDLVRDHELVHVRQYERWGPLFIPTYLAWALWLTWQGKSGYWDNPFEKEAYTQSWSEGEREEP